MRGWLCVLALAGCDRVFGIGDPYEDASRVGDTNGDSHMAPVDVLVSDATLASQAIVHFSFDTGLSDDKGQTMAICTGNCRIVTTAEVGSGSLQLLTSSCAKFGLVVPSPPFSIALWVNPTTTDAQTLLSRSLDGTTSPVWQLHAAGIGDGFIAYNQTAGVDQDEPIEASLAADSWQHLVVTYDGSILSTYANGQALPTSYTINIPASSSSEALLGCNIDQMSGFFTGFIDDVYVFDRALTGNEVAILYAAR